MECDASGRRRNLLSLPGACVRDKPFCAILRMLKWGICVIIKKFYEPNFFKSLKSSFPFRQKLHQIIEQKAAHRMLQLIFLLRLPVRANKRTFLTFHSSPIFQWKFFSLKIFLTQSSWEWKCVKSNSTFCVKHYLFTDNANRYIHKSTKAWNDNFHLRVLITFVQFQYDERF